MGIMEKKIMETTIVYWGYMGIMKKKMKATIVYWGYMGIMEKKMEATIIEAEDPQLLVYLRHKQRSRFSRVFQVIPGAAVPSYVLPLEDDCSCISFAALVSCSTARHEVRNELTAFPKAEA